MFASTSASLIRLCYYWKRKYLFVLLTPQFGAFSPFSAHMKPGQKRRLFGHTNVCPVSKTIFLIFFHRFGADVEPLTSSPASRRFSLRAHTGLRRNLCEGSTSVQPDDLCHIKLSQRRRRPPPLPPPLLLLPHQHGNMLPWNEPAVAPSKPHHRPSADACPPSLNPRPG